MDPHQIRHDYSEKSVWQIDKEEAYANPEFPDLDDEYDPFK